MAMKCDGQSFLGLGQLSRDTTAGTVLSVHTAATATECKQDAIGECLLYRSLLQAPFPLWFLRISMNASSLY